MSASFIDLLTYGYLRHLQCKKAQGHSMSNEEIRDYNNLYQWFMVGISADDRIKLRCGLKEFVRPRIPARKLREDDHD